MLKRCTMSWRKSHSHRVLRRSVRAWAGCRHLGKNTDSFTHASNNYILLSMARQERLLPAAVIKETLEEKVEAIEVTGKPQSQLAREKGNARGYRA